MTTHPQIIARFLKKRAGFTLDVDIAIPARGITGLFGHSGSGKTTLLRLIAGLETAEGCCQFKDQCWQDATNMVPTYKRPIGYVFQDANLFPHLTVEKNLKFGQTRHRGKQSIALDHAIELLGINHLLSRKPAQLSGGEKQRVGIARALAVSPQLLLMDEPLSALDLARKQEILPYLERLHHELDIPMLYVSHAPDEIARLADHIVVMEKGSVITTGNLTDTLSRIDLPIRLGEDAGVVLKGTITEKDTTWHLMKLNFPGGTLWTRDNGKPLGYETRIRVLARDVSISVSKPTEKNSIQNHLSGMIDDIQPDEHPGLSLVRILIGESAIVARVTARSAHELRIGMGQEVWAQVKSVALIE